MRYCFKLFCGNSQTSTILSDTTQPYPQKTKKSKKMLIKSKIKKVILIYWREPHIR